MRLAVLLAPAWRIGGVEASPHISRATSRSNFVAMVAQSYQRSTSHCRSPCGRLARRAIFRFTQTPNQWLNSGYPVPTRGAVARRHERGMGCGGRDSVGAQLMSQGGLNLVSDVQARKTNDV
jgi:hypothetical protein